tara:strand:+ start:68 stop:208 length:141 start_codon:yes stop_codon:yes gene_type:complete
MNWNGEKYRRDDYYIEGQEADFGHGFRQSRDVINVYTKAITQAVLI